MRRRRCPFLASGDFPAPGLFVIYLSGRSSLSLLMNKCMVNMKPGVLDNVQKVPIFLVHNFNHTKRFTAAEDISGTNIVKSSVQRSIRKDILERYPALEPYMDELMPKKEDVYLTKCSNKITLISCNGQEPLFFQDGNGPYVPCLRVIHKGIITFDLLQNVVPVDILPRVQVDKGAIKFILQGADVMAPGLTSEMGFLPDGLEANQLVVIHAEGKENALAVGKMMSSSADIKATNQGHAIANLHCLCDGLWKVESLKP